MPRLAPERVSGALVRSASTLCLVPSPVRYRKRLVALTHSPQQVGEVDHAAGGALGHAALDGGDAVDLPGPEARPEPVDKTAHVGIGRRLLQAVRPHLPLAEGLDLAGDELHLLNAEARIDRLQALVEQADEMWHLPGRPGRPDPQGGAAPVDPLQQEVEAAHALATLLRSLHRS